MFQRIHQKLGTAGFIISIVALVAALGGGAYAASNGLNAKQKKEVKNIAKQVAKPGAPGAIGAPGATGPAGQAGAPGAKGDTGAKGDNGSAGLAGQEGPEGPEGPEGSPWVDGGTLPTESTETGTWGIYGGAVGPVNVPINFAIPLADAPEAHLLADNATTADCPGEVDGLPTAEPGHLCVYTTVTGEEVTSPEIYYPDPVSEVFAGGASQTGALIRASCEAGYCYQGGNWAVTAE
jgi:hypothetical protein